MKTKNNGNWKETSFNRLNLFSDTEKKKIHLTKTTKRCFTIARANYENR